MVSLPWKNYSACLALLLARVSCLMCASPLPQMLPPNPYLQMSGVSSHFLTGVAFTVTVILVKKYLSSLLHSWKGSYDMPHTTIQSITVEPLTIPLLEPFTIATGSVSEARNVLITVTLRDGSVGYGECAPFPPST